MSSLHLSQLRPKVYFSLSMTAALRIPAPCRVALSSSRTLLGNVVRMLKGKVARLGLAVVMYCRRSPTVCVWFSYGGGKNQIPRRLRKLLEMGRTWTTSREPSWSLTCKLVSCPDKSILADSLAEASLAALSPGLVAAIGAEEPDITAGTLLPNM